MSDRKTQADGLRGALTHDKTYCIIRYVFSFIRLKFFFFFFRFILLVLLHHPLLVFFSYIYKFCFFFLGNLLESENARESRRDSIEVDLLPNCIIPTGWIRCHSRSISGVPWKLSTFVLRVVVLRHHISLWLVRRSSTPLFCSAFLLLPAMASTSSYTLYIDSGRNIHTSWHGVVVYRTRDGPTSTTRFFKLKEESLD